jgi:hypothetical protein
VAPVPESLEAPALVTSRKRRGSVRWRIGDICLRLTTSDLDLELVYPPSLAAFACDDDAPDIDLVARWGENEPSDEPPVSFDSGGLWVLRRSDRELVFEFRTPRYGDVPYKVARFAPDCSRGEIVLHRPYFPGARRIHPLDYPLDELVFTNVLARRGGVELHGCGLAADGEGLLFLGFSGAGKSTMARLWHDRPGATVLSDDRIILRVENGRVLMHGTPWHGDEALAAPGPVPLTRLFFLRQGTDRALQGLTGSAAVARLFTCGFIPFYSTDAIAATLSTLEKVAQLVPCADLWFTPDAATIDFLVARG